MGRSKTVIVAVLIAAAYSPAALAQGFTTIFNAMVEDRRVIAVSFEGAVYIGDVIDEMRAFAGSGRTVLAYLDHEAVSETEPLAVFVDGELTTFASLPNRSTAPPTIADSTQLATTIERGRRTGAVCNDGSRTTTAHDGACRLRGGVARWLFSATARSDGNKTVASICADYRLVSGEGALCGNSKVVTQIRALVYPNPTPAPPPNEEPESEPALGLPVEPLPGGGAIEIPKLDDSKVTWGERQNGRISFSWSTGITNTNDVPVHVAVGLRLRDGDGEIVHSEEHVVALDPGEALNLTEVGDVSEVAARRAARWTFDVELAPDDVPVGDLEEPGVTLVVNPLAEEARITNIGESELDLNGWTLVSRRGGETFTFRFFKLDPGESVTLTSGKGARSMLPEIYLWTASEIWSDDGDIGELRDPRGRVRASTNPDGSAAR